MTPQENAIYLIHLFNRGGYGKINARIHVEEILSINSVDKDEDLSNYWEQVKQEIEKTMTNNKQQTAVDWLIEQLSTQFTYGEKIQFERLFEMAKERDKEQHEATALSMIEYALDNIEGKNNLNGKDAFEQYYNETYGGGKQ
jgi:GH24 family phage-related lysozyme (muramidase)